jgi:hypothetical protein
MPGPEGGAVPGRRLDAVGGTSRGRHLALTVADSGCLPVLIRAGSGAGVRAAHGRGGERAGQRGDIDGWSAAAGAATSLARAVPGGGLAAGSCPAASAGTAVTGVPAATLCYARWDDARRRPWNGSWNGAPGNPSTTGAMSAITRAIGAARALSARGRTYGKEKVYGSIP